MLHISCRKPRDAPSAAAALALVLAACCSCAPLRAAPGPADREEAKSEGRDLPPIELGGHVFHRRLLGNGLHAAAVRDDGAGVSVFVVIAAGKRQETAETTGLAHLTEHAMYTGTRDTGPGEHDRRIQEMGGKSNAFTRDDYTLFYDHEVPVLELEAVLAMEADRMRQLLFDPDAFYEERERLREEETKTWQPSQQLTERLEAAVFRSHPYAAGVMDDAGRTFASVLGIWDVRAFYDAYYQPEAAAVVVAGSVEPGDALDAVDAAFGRLPAGPPRQAIPEEPYFAGPRSVSLPSNLPRDRVEWVWLIPEMGHPDRSALAVLARLLARKTTGDGSPFFVSMGERVDRDLFRLAAVGSNAADELDRLVSGLRAETLDTSDFDDVVGLEAAARSEQPLRGRPYFSLAASFGVYEALGHAEVLARRRPAVEAVTLEDVSRVVRDYLGPERRVEVRFVGTGAELPPLPEGRSELHRAADEATQAGNLDWAVLAYTKLLSLELSEMSEVIALASRGKVLMQQREYDAAIRDFERALAVIDYPDLHDLLDEARALEAGEIPESLD